MFLASILPRRSDLFMQLNTVFIQGMKYGNGSHVRTGWIFGSYNAQTRHGFFHQVPDLFVNISIPTIQRMTTPGSTIINRTDEFALCGQLTQLGYTDPKFCYILIVLLIMLPTFIPLGVK